MCARMSVNIYLFVTSVCDLLMKEATNFILYSMIAKYCCTKIICLCVATSNA